MNAWDELVLPVIISHLVAFLLGVASAIGLPWLWSILKPLIHMVTA
jgi:hypothetical protein